MTLKTFLAGTLIAGASVTHAGILAFQTTLGPEVTGATGSGFATVLYDDVERILSWSIAFAGLSGTTTVAHFHCCTAAPGTGFVGVAVSPGTLPGFPTGLSSGTDEGSIDLDLTTSFTNGFRGSDTPQQAAARFIQGIYDGKNYLNIHTTTFGGGEIRGFLQVPEPSALLLAGLALAGLATTSRRRPVTP